MSEFRQRAIEDVAEAMRCEPEILRGQMDVDPKLLCNAEYKVYAVAQRERVLELEAVMERILKRFDESDNGTLHVRDGVAWAMAADARHAITGEATHEA